MEMLGKRLRLPGSSGGNGRMPAPHRRRHLLDTAQRIFSTSGFRGTSTKAIAEAAGVSEALLFRHFPSKADLYTAILLEKAAFTGLSDRIEEFCRLAQGDDDEALVRFFVRGTIENNERDLPFARLMLYAALEGHELASTSKRIFENQIMATLLEYVERRQRAGVFKAGDPRLVALGIYALPAHFSLTYRVLPEEPVPFPMDEVVELVTRMVWDSVRLQGGATGKRRRTARRPRSRTT
jgi:TetR/AcrR family transcriptional regulator